MNRIKLVFLIIFLITSLSSFAQESAIGARISSGINTGLEASFQTEMWGQRVEADLGFGYNYNNYNYVNLTGLYQLVFPIDFGFYWFVGGGPSIMPKSYYATPTENAKLGLDIGIAFNGGAEYNFPNIPLQVAIDARPTIYLVQGDTHNWFNFAASARYKF